MTNADLYRSELVFTAHALGYWTGKMEARMMALDADEPLKFAAKAAFHYAAVWLEGIRDRGPHQSERETKRRLRQIRKHQLEMAGVKDVRRQLTQKGTKVA